MAPAVPFALLGVVQLTAVVSWVGLAAAACFPALRRRGTPVLVLGALAMAGAEVATALRFGDASSDPLALLRVFGLLLVAAGLLGDSLQPQPLPAVVVPLGARSAPAIVGGAIGVVAAAVGWWRGRRAGADRVVAGGLVVGLLFTAVAAVLADPARSNSDAAIAELAARAAASLAFVGVLAWLARQNLLGKVVGAIVAGVVAMAVGAVAVVGIGVADQVQRDQSNRLLSVANAQQQQLAALATRAGLYAKVVSLCPADRSRCVAFLRLFATDPDYFAVLDFRGSGLRTVAPSATAVSHAGLLQLAGSRVVRAAMRRSATAQAVASGPVLLDGSPQRLAVVAAVPGRPRGAPPGSRPTFAAVYGIGVVDSYLRSIRAQTGYDVSVIVNDRVLSSSLDAAERRQVHTEARSGGVRDAGPTTSQVVPAQGDAPTVAFVPVTEAGNDDVRIATLAVSQPASVALAAQRSVLRRLVLTALVVLVVVALLAFLLAQRIADPVRRLTVAAGRVRRGDLESTAALASRDEVGVLARAFDDMTASLRGLTGDLRTAAAEEAALRARLETVVGSMTDGLIATDAAGMVTGVNAAALFLLAVDTEAELLARPLEDVVHVRDGDSPVLVGELPERATVDARLRRADDTSVPVRVAVSPLADGQGRVVVLADRSREHEIERMKSEFLANVSHELRTPLTPIRGYAELLSRRRDISAKQAGEFVDEILAASARMNRVVELLVDVAALDAGRVTPQRQPTSAASLVRDRLADWRARYPDRADDFTRRVSPRLPTMSVDPYWLTKALDELADNAVKHTPSGATITLAVTAGDASGQVRIAVRDAGPGVDLDRLAELLGDFSQADASETRRAGGMGLGLGFVSRVADRLGLTLRVSSRAGRGSEFAFDVPTDRAPSSAGPRRQAARR